MPAGDVPEVGLYPPSQYLRPAQQTTPQPYNPGRILTKLDSPDDAIVLTLDCDGSSGNRDLEAEVAARMIQAFNLWKERQQKYGVTNIARTGALGCYVRCEDKLSRLHRVYVDLVGTDMPDESVRDSWLDIVNYAIMGLMNHEGAWPKA